MINSLRGRPKTFDTSHVINTALYNYWEKGMKNVSLNQLCKECNVSKPGLYREFKNEDGLMKEVILTYKKQIIIPLLKILENESSFRETLDKMISIFTRSNNKNKSPKGCLLVKLNESPEELGKATLKAINQTKQYMLKSFENWVKTCKSRGEISNNISPKLAANYIDTQFDNALSMLIKNKNKKVVKKFLLLALSPIMTK